VRRVLLVGALAAAAAVAFAGPAGATNECRGLQVCIRVAGPWVVVPTARTVPRPLAEFDLSCPEGAIVAGLDAELSEQAVDVNWLAMLGAPVNPGVSTDRAALFYGRYVGASAAAPTFRPHLGCVPTQGGGVRVPTSAARIYPPGHPTTRRVKTVRIQPGRTTTVAQACRPGETLVDTTHAVGFYTAQPPAARLVGAVSVSERIRGNRVAVTARAGAPIAGARAVVQVGALCAGATA